MCCFKLYIRLALSVIWNYQSKTVSCKSFFINFFQNTSEFSKKKRESCESIEDVPIEDLTVEVKDESDSFEHEQKINKLKSKRVHFNEEVLDDEPRKKKVKYDNYEQYVSEDTVSNTIEEVIVKYASSKEKSKRGGALRAMLQEYYNIALSEMSPRAQRRRCVPTIETTFQCCCIDGAVDTDHIQCPSCKTWQHSGCVGFDQTVATYDYYCFKCWQNNPLVPSAGTVIISPDSISCQWVTEVSTFVNVCECV